MDSLLDSICDALVRNEGAHTILLYGSRVDDSANRYSDYDIAAFAPVVRTVRDTRIVESQLLDVFVHPETALQAPGQEHLPLRSSRVLLQRGHEATRFLARLDEIHRQGPDPLPDDEITARLTWARKMALRARRLDTEGDYRRTWLLTALLEDYFHVRAMWYEGPKRALRWLLQHDPETHGAFERALKANASLDTIDLLVQRYVDKYTAERASSGSLALHAPSPSEPLPGNEADGLQKN